MPEPTFAERAAPTQQAIAEGAMDPQGQNYTPFTPSPALQKFVRQTEDVQTSNDAAFQKFQADTAKPRAAIAESTGQIPQPPTAQKLGPAPDAKEYQKHAMGFASAMAILGALSGKFTRMSGANSLNAFAGAMNGWKEGNLQAYEQAAQKWEQDTKATIENNRQAMDKYKLILQNHKLKIDEQLAQLQVSSVQFHDTMMYNAAKSGNLAQVTNIYDKEQNAHEQLQYHYAQLRQRKEEQTEQSKRNISYYVNHPEKFLELSDQEQAAWRQNMQILKMGTDSSIFGRGVMTPDKIALQKFMEENPSATAEEIQNFQSRSRQPRSAPGMALLKFMQENPGATSEEITKFSSNYSGEQAYQRGAGTYGARIETAVNEVEQVMPLALEASRNLPRGEIVPFNKLVQQFEQGTSDPAYNDFLVKNFALINAYTRAMNPTGVPRVQERLEQHAIGLLSMATSPKAYEVQLRALWQEVQASKTAVAKTKEGRTPGDINSPMPQSAGAANETKVLDGKTYVKRNGQWFEQ